MIPPGISQKSTSKISRGNFLRSFCQEKRDILENFSKYSKLSSANSLRNNLYYPPGIPPENTSEILPKILSGNKKKIPMNSYCKWLQRYLRSIPRENPSGNYQGVSLWKFRHEISLENVSKTSSRISVIHSKISP